MTHSTWIRPWLVITCMFGGIIIISFNLYLKGLQFNVHCTLCIHTTWQLNSVSEMTHFAMVNIFYSSKSIAKKAGTLYPNTLAYIICTYLLLSLCSCINPQSFSLLLLNIISATTKSRLCVDMGWNVFLLDSPNNPESCSETSPEAMLTVSLKQNQKTTNPGILIPILRKLGAA